MQGQLTLKHISINEADITSVSTYITTIFIVFMGVAVEKNYICIYAQLSFNWSLILSQVFASIKISSKKKSSVLHINIAIVHHLPDLLFRMTNTFSRFDVTEAQMSVIIILLTTAVFGNGVWNTALLRHLILGCSMIGSVYQILGYTRVIFSGGVGKNGSTIAILLLKGTSVIFPLFPLFMVIIPFCMIYSRTSSNIYDQHITLFMLCLGAVEQIMLF
uniref:TPT domain-containing protein n=1 Tax=Heterorhabditis bacteriophora TaxID=37862 RepID=A0A1I7WF82_HETBA